MDNARQVEEHTLIEILDDMETLCMMDGSKWSVSPGDQTIICTWLPTSNIEIELIDAGSMWPYELTNTGEGVSVRARQI